MTHLPANRYITEEGLAPLCGKNNVSVDSSTRVGHAIDLWGTLKRFQRLRTMVAFHLGLGSAACALDPNPRLRSVATLSLPRRVRGL